MKRNLFIKALTLLFLVAPVRLNNCFGSTQTAQSNPIATVYIYLGTECPFSQNYTKSLNSLYEKYKPSGVAFVGVFSNLDDSQKKIKEFVKLYNIEFPTIRDKKHKYVNRYQATITPEIVVIDIEGERVYSGKIDNWAEDLGVRRAVVTKFYLNDALYSVINNIPLKVKTTTAVGCFIHSPNPHKNHHVK